MIKLKLLSKEYEFKDGYWTKSNTFKMAKIQLSEDKDGIVDKLDYTIVTADDTLISGKLSAEYTPNFEKDVTEALNLIDKYIKL